MGKGDITYGADVRQLFRASGTGVKFWKLSKIWNRLDSRREFREEELEGREGTEVGKDRECSGSSY